MQTIRLIVSGQVQGVFFRASAKEKADELRLTGTVSNLAGGEVEIIATGEKEQLKALEDWCWTGPPRAKVDNVSRKEVSFQLFESFLVIRGKRDIK